MRAGAPWLWAVAVALVVGAFGSRAHADTLVPAVVAADVGVVAKNTAPRRIDIPPVAVPDEDAVKEPPLWAELRSLAVSHLPKREGEDGFVAVLAPQVVSNGFSTTAGVGFIGRF